MKGMLFLSAIALSITYGNAQTWNQEAFDADDEVVQQVAGETGVYYRTASDDLFKMDQNGFSTQISSSSSIDEIIGVADVNGTETVFYLDGNNGGPGYALMANLDTVISTISTGYDGGSDIFYDPAVGEYVFAIADDNEIFVGRLDDTLGVVFTGEESFATFEFMDVEVISLEGVAAIDESGGFAELILDNSGIDDDPFYQINDLDEPFGIITDDAGKIIILDAGEGIMYLGFDDSTDKYEVDDEEDLPISLGLFDHGISFDGLDYDCDGDVDILVRSMNYTHVFESGMSQNMPLSYSALLTPGLDYLPVSFVNNNDIGRKELAITVSSEEIVYFSHQQIECYGVLGVDEAALSEYKGDIIIHDMSGRSLYSGPQHDSYHGLAETGIYIIRTAKGEFLKKIFIQ